MNRPTAAVIVPALDEAENIGLLVEEIKAAVACLQDTDVTTICVVDNGSTDATAQVAQAAGATVVYEPRRGYGRSCLSGAIACEGVELLIYMDGDRSEVPAEMGTLLAPVLAGEADLTIGSRVRGQLEPGALTSAQRWGNRVASWLMFAQYRVRISDLGPYRVIRRDDLLSLGMTEMSYGWPSEMIARAAKAGLRIHELPVSCRRRSAGVSKVSGNVKASALTGWRIANVIFGAGRS